VFPFRLFSLLLSIMTPTPATILFDGVCNLCNGFVQFVVRHDRPGRFRFASLRKR
jgi:predicted DCC family thiol-disulfide oxidoreductase YuxK